MFGIYEKPLVTFSNGNDIIKPNLLSPGNPVITYNTSHKKRVVT